MTDKDRGNFFQQFPTESGFSLFELLLVCALVGIMLFLALPAVRHVFIDDPLKSTARKTIGLVNGVRELALREQQLYTLYLNRAERKLWFKKDKDDSEGDEGKTVERLFRFPENIKMTEIVTSGRDVSTTNEVAVWITNRGFMHETTIRFEDDTGSALILKFFPFVTAVQLFDGNDKTIQ